MDRQPFVHRQVEATLANECPVRRPSGQPVGLDVTARITLELSLADPDVRLRLAAFVTLAEWGTHTSAVASFVLPFSRGWRFCRALRWPCDRRLLHGLLGLTALLPLGQPGVVRRVLRLDGKPISTSLNRSASSHRCRWPNVRANSRRAPRRCGRRRDGRSHSSGMESGSCVLTAKSNGG
jgi:hypothetical protein